MDDQKSTAISGNIEIKKRKGNEQTFGKNPHLRLQQMIEQLKADRDKYLAERNQLQKFG